LHQRADAKTHPTSEAAHPTTFGDIADRFIADRETTWRNAAHRRQWRQTLEIQAAPLWNMPAAEIDTAAVLDIIRPLWAVKPETARRMRGRIERILDAARVMGHRTGENPARWRGHLDALLPPAAKLTRGHHAALPYKEVPAFYALLAERPAPSARALSILILTAARSGEVRGMLAGEVDLAAALWTVPAARMKAKREHRVPLSAPAIEMLRLAGITERAPDELVFPNSRLTKMSDMIFGALLKRMGRGDYTTHGFRSSFRDWAADETDHRREVIEASLAHLVGDETERAYRRGDALEKRRQLLDDWAAFVGSAGGSPEIKA
jgi:integrase